MNAARKPAGRRLAFWALIVLIVAIVAMLAVAILLVHPSLLLFIGGALVPTAMPFMMRHPSRMFLAWASGTVTVAAIAPIVTRGLFDSSLPVHTDMRSWLIALGASFFGYGIALVCPWLGERVAVARHKLSEMKFDRRRTELIEIWTEQRLRKPASARPVIGQDFVSEEEGAVANTNEAAPPAAPPPAEAASA
ncbi:MAG: hypothetical protein HY059_08845 [Proteobacteria bacterium]|nr:hypothetical protein [Pseudomonadota bacterium]